jgi:hypothetical protein
LNLRPLDPSTSDSAFLSRFAPACTPVRKYALTCTDADQPTLLPCAASSSGLRTYAPQSASKVGRPSNLVVASPLVARRRHRPAPNLGWLPSTRPGRDARSWSQSTSRSSKGTTRPPTSSRHGDAHRGRRPVARPVFPPACRRRLRHPRPRRPTQNPDHLQDASVTRITAADTWPVGLARSEWPGGWTG